MRLSLRRWPLFRLGLGVSAGRSVQPVNAVQPGSEARTGSRVLPDLPVNAGRTGLPASEEKPGPPALPDQQDLPDPSGLPVGTAPRSLSSTPTLRCLRVPRRVP